MEGKIILFRNQSEESEIAENLLRKYNIDFVQHFCSDGNGRLPSLINPGNAYHFEGIEGIKIFLGRE